MLQRQNLIVKIEEKENKLFLYEDVAGITSNFSRIWTN